MITVRRPRGRPGRNFHSFCCPARTLRAAHADREQHRRVFSLLSLDETLVDAADLISPVVDMEKLICNMMKWANVTEREHKD